MKVVLLNRSYSTIPPNYNQTKNQTNIDYYFIYIYTDRFINNTMLRALQNIAKL